MWAPTPPSRLHGRTAADAADSYSAVGQGGAPADTSSSADGADLVVQVPLLKYRALLGAFAKRVREAEVLRTAQAAAATERAALSAHLTEVTATLQVRPCACSGLSPGAWG
jgi:hypothetical protein